jgi:hypothetical protein
VSFPIRFLGYVLRVFRLGLSTVIGRSQLHLLFGVVIGLGAFCELLAFVLDSPRGHNPSRTRI